MKTLLAITNALSDVNRARIVCALARCEELCVCQIHEMLGLAPSTTSKHLSLLVSAGLLDSRKEGRWVYYCLPEEAEPAVAEVLDWFCTHAEEEKAITEDEKRLDRILAYTPEELCQRQARGTRCC